MHREALSREELELLRTTSPRPETGAAEPDAAEAPASWTSLPAFHTSFVRTLTAWVQAQGLPAASGQLRDAAEGTYAQFVLAQPIPTCCAVLEVEGGEALLAIDPALLYPLLDGSMGAPAREPVPGGALTEIEAVLAKRLVEQLLDQYTHALKEFRSWSWQVKRLTHNAQELRAMSGAQRLFLTQFELQANSHYGRLTLALPLHLAQQLEAVLSDPPA